MWPAGSSRCAVSHPETPPAGLPPSSAPPAGPWPLGRAPAPEAPGCVAPAASSWAACVAALDLRRSTEIRLVQDSSVYTCVSVQWHLTLRTGLRSRGVGVLSAERRHGRRPHMTDHLLRLHRNLLVTEQVRLHLTLVLMRETQRLR